MHQAPYISKLLEKMDMSTCKGSRTPYIANTNWKTELQATTDDEKNDVIGWYLTVLGAFRWIKTRVDLMVQLLKMSSVMHNPGYAVIKHVTKFARYLQQTINYKWTLQYDSSIGTGPLTVSYYPDASWLDGAGQKSTAGMAVFVGRLNLVYAVSKYLPTQATSTAHAEIQMLAIAAHHSVFMREMIVGAGLQISLPITFWEDNTTARKHSGPDNQQQPLKFIENEISTYSGTSTRGHGHSTLDPDGQTTRKLLHQERNHSVIRTGARQVDAAKRTELCRRHRRRSHHPAVDHDQAYADIADDPQLW